MVFQFRNEGQTLTWTDYWESEHARIKGLAYISCNAGALRLLVPRLSEGVLEEMLTGRHVTLEPSLQVNGHIDVVFEDGSSSPFALAIDPKQIDRKLSRGMCKLLLVSETRGEVACFDCEINL